MNKVPHYDVDVISKTKSAHSDSFCKNNIKKEGGGGGTCATQGREKNHCLLFQWGDGEGVVFQALWGELCEGRADVWCSKDTKGGGGGGGAWAGPGWSFDCHQAELGVQLLLPSGNTGLLVLLCYCCAWQLLSLLSRCMRSVVIITDGGWGAYLQITAMAVQHFPGRSLGTFFIHFFFF